MNNLSWAINYCLTCCKSSAMSGSLPSNASSTSTYLNITTNNFTQRGNSSPPQQFDQILPNHYYLFPWQFMLNTMQYKCPPCKTCEGFGECEETRSRQSSRCAAGSKAGAVTFRFLQMQLLLQSYIESKSCKSWKSRSITWMTIRKLGYFMRRFM